jgi:hypothetical protein
MEQIPEPVPASRGFDDGVMRAGEAGEVLHEQAPVVREGDLLEPLALGRECGQDKLRRC